MTSNFSLLTDNLSNEKRKELIDFFRKNYPDTEHSEKFKKEIRERYLKKKKLAKDYYFFAFPFYYYCKDELSEESVGLEITSSLGRDCYDNFFDEFQTLFHKYVKIHYFSEKDYENIFDNYEKMKELKKVLTKLITKAKIINKKRLNIYEHIDIIRLKSMRLLVELAMKYKTPLLWLF